jgi:siroheme decarboxylase
MSAPPPLSALLTADELRLVDRWQRGFPLEPAPFAAIARRTGLGEAAVISGYRRLAERGIVGRIGAVLAPNTVGASTLAAMAVPPERLEEVAAIASAEPGVSHNYAREHSMNLWFVVTGRSEAEVAAALRRVERTAGLPVNDLRLIEPYHLDLGFPLGGREEPKIVAGHAPEVDAIRPGDADLLAALGEGLPLVPRPFGEMARALDLSEADVLRRLKALVRAGIVRRFGVVVRHRRLGYHANVMAVWDVDDRIVGELGRKLAHAPGITLAYRRRRTEAWRFNLYCMVHARSRPEAEAHLARADRLVGNFAQISARLYAARCFKQTGARLAPTREIAA